jgi:hypothetical protein
MIHAMQVNFGAAFYDMRGKRVDALKTDVS